MLLIMCCLGAAADAQKHINEQNMNNAMAVYKKGIRIRPVPNKKKATANSRSGRFGMFRIGSTYYFKTDHSYLSITRTVI